VAEIVLADLLAWMPTLRPVWPTEEDRAWLAQPISWAVAARSGTPLLPVLRGGEIVVVSPQTLIDQGIDVRDFAVDLGRIGFAAMVLLGFDPAGVTLDIPWLGLSSSSRPSSIEGEINRLLTEQRGLLYSRGSDLGRTLLAALTVGAEPAAITALGAASAGIPMVLEETDVPRQSRPASPEHGVGTDSIVVTVGEHARLSIGPLPTTARAFASLAGEQVGEAIETAMRRADLLKPRGRARAAAMRSLLLGEATPGAAAALGLTVDARYRVAMAAAEVALRDAGRIAGPGVLLHEAGDLSGIALAVLERRDSSPPGTLPVARLASALGQRSWLVFSDEVGLDGLVDAMEQARFATSLLAAGEIEGPVVAFDAFDRLGVYRLLFRMRGDSALARFVEDTLAGLDQEDRRGVLRETLQAYLTAGGAGVETAARLGIHRNTLAYRLRRIAALTGRDPADPRHWLSYGVALAADRVLNVER